MNLLPFIDLHAQRQRLGARIDQAVQRVIESGSFILGPEVSELEQRLTEFCGAMHTVTCANGTDALTLILMAEEIGPGDAVFVPAFTFVATAEAVALRGAVPYFVDVDAECFCIDPESINAAITDVRARGLRPRAIIAVDLFGLPADYDRLRKAADCHDILLIADAAQSFGARYNNSMVGTLADYTTTSFFPAKPLGCYGDGGAVFVNRADQANILRSLRFHGKGNDKYDNIRLGLNSRLDTIQAAILIEKLSIFADELDARERLAANYARLLGSLEPIITTPKVPNGRRSSWAQYTLRSQYRSMLLTACRAAGIPTQIYYPIPLHRQSGYQHFPAQPGGLPISERLAAEVFSIPMHPYLADSQQQFIASTLRDAVRSHSLQRAE